MIFNTDPNLLAASEEERESRRTEFSHMKDVCYLDYTAAGIYSQSQMDEVAAQMKTNLFCHPHGSSTISDVCASEVDQMREKVLDHFDTDSEEYAVIFTSGATSAIKTVAEYFQFNQGTFLYLTDNHTSVLGMREVVQTNSVQRMTVDEAERVLNNTNIENGNSSTMSGNTSTMNGNTSTMNMNGNTSTMSGNTSTMNGNTSTMNGNTSTMNMNGNTSTMNGNTSTMNCNSGTMNGNSSTMNGNSSTMNGNMSTKHGDSPNKTNQNSLFVYPAQSNFSGRKYPLSWIKNVHSSPHLSQHTRTNSNWFVLLDSATYCSSNKLSLKVCKPDFVCISFYKMFGYPTGLGALIVKRSSAAVLNKTYYGGGTVKIALANENFHVKKDDLSEQFEDGTVNYLSIIALRHGFVARAASWNGDKVFELSQYTHWYLKHLYYPNKRRAVQLYHDNDFSSSHIQGNMVNFNLRRKDGTYYGYSEVQNVANLLKIQLRTGCHCNPGSCQKFLELSDEIVKYHFQQGHVCGDDKDIIDGRPTGSVRISFGYASNWDDVNCFLAFIKRYFLQDATFTQDDVDQKDTELGQDVEEEVEVHTAEGRLERMFLYPVKACGRYEVKTKWEVNAGGLLYDRQWMIVNKTGVVLTQKHEKKLCLIQPNFDLSRNVLILSFRGSDACVEISLEQDEEDEKYLGLCRSKVCRDSITGYDCTDDVAHWLDCQLNHDGLRLIRLKQRMGSHNLRSLSNMGQYLLITLPSIQAQLERIANKCDVHFDPVSFINRFRSNFVISGDFKASAEAHWSDILVKTTSGVVPFEVKKQCMRCQYIYIDQETGHVTDVPLSITKFGIYISNNFSVESGETVELSIRDTFYFKIKR